MLQQSTTFTKNILFGFGRLEILDIIWGAISGIDEITTSKSLLTECYHIYGKRSYIRNEFSIHRIDNSPCLVTSVSKKQDSPAHLKNILI